MKWYRLLPSMTTFVECSGNSLASCGLNSMKVVNPDIPIITVINVYYYFVVVTVIEEAGDGIPSLDS